MDRFAQGTAKEQPTVAQESLCGRISSLSDLREYAAKIATNAEELADKIAGTQPEKNPSPAPSIVPNGLADHLQLAKEAIYAQLDRAERAYQRIERAVG